VASIDDLDLPADHPIDDRWTESKLIAAGYRYTGDGRCKRGCGEDVCFYVKETLQGKRWLVLDEAVLSPHRCDR
jgi:hypothetical protein